ncbi:MAG: protein-glutamate O-methyltransferase CheR [Tissierellaceae bacterium]|nr:protein-glutamate O-methyltransferase CheR [Tissierellaceae bacterium]
MLEITAKEFQLLTDYINDNYGIRLRDEKKSLVIGRLQKVLEEMNFATFSEYYHSLLKDKTGEKARQLAERITTNHTYFMREAAHFDFFKDKVLPYLEKSIRTKDMRIWSAACSTGEEPYTLAMIIDEFLGSEKIHWDTKILATDISEKVLNKGKRGVYSTISTGPIPPHWKLNYMKKYDSRNMVFKDNIKSEVIFRKFNLMDEFPFKKKFHVVFLRNVMIYFDEETKRKLLGKIYDSLEYGGYLFVGHSEGIQRENTRFNYIMPAVYRK